MTIQIVHGGSSAVKIRALEDALIGLTKVKTEIVAAKVTSGIDEQPLGYEMTVAGAKERIRQAQQLHPGADIYVAIENGIMREQGRFIDRAVVVVCHGGMLIIESSAGIEFPAKYVALSVESNLTVTVGKLMARDGLVRQHDDPHLDIELVGEPGVRMSRAVVLREALVTPLRDTLAVLRKR